MRFVTALASAIATSLILAATVIAAAPSPPAGQLFVDGAGPFEGTLGSNCVDTGSTFGCSDTPWLRPKNGPSLAPGANLRFAFADATSITSWEATFGDAADADPDISELGGEDGVNIDAADFPAPPAGDWVMSVFARFENSEISGDVTYYYRLHVGAPDTDTVAPAASDGPAAPHELPWVTLVLAAIGGLALGWRRFASGRPVTS
jgi:hypothetical protein